MPFPIIALTLGVAGQSAAPYIVAGIGSVGWTVHCYFKGNQGLPTFHATAEEAVKSARADIDALVTATSEHLHQVEVDTLQQNARIDEASANYELNLITMERGTVKLDEAVRVVVESQKENTGELRHAIETQIDTEVSLKAQQTMVQSIAASLEGLPELLQLNRERQALRVENAHLSLENKGYASHTETLLSVVREQREENAILKDENERLKVQVSGYASQVNTLLALVKDMSSEVDKRRTDNTQNTGTHFSLNLFS